MKNRRTVHRDQEMPPSLHVPRRPRSFSQGASVSRSHARVPFTRQTGLRFLRALASRRMLIFAIHTAGNLTYIIIRMSWPRSKSRFLADLESS